MAPFLVDHGPESQCLLKGEGGAGLDELTCDGTEDAATSEVDSSCADQRSEDQDLSRLISQIPHNSQGQLTSIGSIEHASNTCKPCLFWFQGTCSKGVLCTYCHMAHKGQRTKRIRPGKKMREYFKSQFIMNEPEEVTSIADTFVVPPSLPPGLETPVVAVRKRNVRQDGGGTINSVGDQNDGFFSETRMTPQVDWSAQYQANAEVLEPSRARAETKLRSSAALFQPKQSLLSPYIAGEWQQFSNVSVSDSHGHIPYDVTHTRGYAY